METMKQSGLWSSLGTHDSLVVIWWLCISSSGATRKFDILYQIWPCRSRSIVPQNIKYLNQNMLHLWSKFGDPSLNGWWIMMRKISKWGKFWCLSWIWPWRSRSITPQNNIDLNQGLLHLWSKFGDPSLNALRVITQKSWGWHTHRHTHRQMQATTIPEGQNWPRLKLQEFSRTWSWRSP